MKKFFVLLVVGVFSLLIAGAAQALPIVNVDGDGVEDSGGMAFGYFQNSGEFMFFGGVPGSGNYNDEQHFADGILEQKVEDWLGIDPTVFTLTKVNVTITNYADDGTVIGTNGENSKSGTWATVDQSDLLGFYVVKAANNYAMYYLNPAENVGSWSTYDLWAAGYGGEGLDVSHFNGFYTLTRVPEPSTMFLLGAGLVGIVSITKRKMKA